MGKPSSDTRDRMAVPRHWKPQASAAVPASAEAPGDLPGEATRNLRVVLADDHELLRAGVRAVVQQAGCDVVGEAGDGRQAVELAVEHAPDLVFLDISMPLLNGIDAARQIHELCPAVRIIALSVHAQADAVCEMLSAGAAGYLLKSSGVSEFAAAIRAVMSGETYLSPKAAAAIVDRHIRHPLREAQQGDLSPREREVLHLLAEGNTSKEIACALHVSAKTVETHRAQIMDKLGAHNVPALTKFAIRMGLTSLDE